MTTKAVAKKKQPKVKYYLDELAASSSVEFIETYVRHVEGEWTGDLIILEPFQKKIFRELFGRKNKLTGLRRYRRAYIEIPRKNGKSFLAACAVILMLYLDPEPGSKIYSAAGGREQARLVFDVVKQIIEADDFLFKHADIYSNSIIVYDQYGYKKVYKAVSRESRLAHGFNAQCAVVDELHVHKTPELLDALETSQGARRQPLTFMITTAGADFASICRKEHEYAVEVQNGAKKDDTLFVAIFAAKPKANPFLVSTWKKANPNLGVSVYLEYLERQANRAKSSASFLAQFKRLHLGIWTNTMESWLAPHVWSASGKKYDINKLLGRPCFGGMDLALTSDFTALTLLFPLDDGDFVSLNWFFLPQEQGHYSPNKRNASYLDWVKDGYVTETTSKKTTDFRVVIKKIEEWKKKYDLVGLGYDPAHGAMMSIELDERGIDLYKMKSTIDRVTEAFATLAALVIDGKYNHLNNPVLAWNAQNVIVREGQNNTQAPDRRDRNRKIDGIMSNIYAIMLYQFLETTPKKKTYLEDEDVFMLP